MKWTYQDVNASQSFKNNIFCSLSGRGGSVRISMKANHISNWSRHSSKHGEDIGLDVLWAKFSFKDFAPCILSCCILSVSLMFSSKTTLSVKGKKDSVLRCTNMTNSQRRRAVGPEPQSFDYIPVNMSEP